MSTDLPEPTPTPTPPLYCELGQRLAAIIEENKKLRAELEEAREKNKKFVYESLSIYRNIEHLLVENDGR
jgi:hypothetical protein